MRFRLWVGLVILTKPVSPLLLARCSLERIGGGGTDKIMIYVAGRQILKDYPEQVRIVPERLIHGLTALRHQAE